MTVGAALAIVAAAGLAPAAAVDYDGNGTPDVFARKPDGTLWMYSGGAGAAFTLAGRAAGQGWDVFDRIVAPGVWSRDVHPDLLGRSRVTATSPGDTNDALYQVLGDGTGGFPPAHSMFTPGENPTGWLGFGWGAVDALITPGDWDGDGSPDLLARTGDGRLAAYHRDFSLLGIRQGKPLPLAGWGIFDVILGPGDFDGDGHPDLVARRGDTLVLFRGDGAGGLLPGGERIIDQGGWDRFDAILAPGDWDGDGAPDLLARGLDGALLLFSGDGRGGLRAGAQVVGSGWGAFDLIVGAMPNPPDAPPKLPDAPPPSPTSPRPVAGRPAVMLLGRIEPTAPGRIVRIAFRAGSAGVATLTFSVAGRRLPPARFHARAGLNVLSVRTPPGARPDRLTIDLRTTDGAHATDSHPIARSRPGRRPPVR